MKMWLLDESGIGLDYLDYHNAINRSFHKFFQTCRHRNYIFFGTVPYLNFLSKAVRKQIHFQYEATGFDKARHVTHVVTKELQYNEEIERMYRKRIIVEHDNAMRPANSIEFPMPPKKIINEYEKMKTEFTDQILADGRRDIVLAEMRMKARQRRVMKELDVLKESEYASELA